MVIHHIGITLYTASGFFTGYTSIKIVASFTGLPIGTVLACTLGFIGAKEFEFFSGWTNIKITDTIVKEFITGKILTLR